LPAFLQIGTIVTPICAAAAAVWTTVAPSDESLRVTLIAAWALPLAIGWALIYRRRFASYPAVQAVITSLSPGDVGTASAVVVHYRYAVAGTTHHGAHMIFDARRLAVGQGIWVLVSPRCPERSIAWV